MTGTDEGLLAKTDRGTYRWGKYRGFSDNYHCCLLARVHDRPVVSPPHEVSDYGIDRELNQEEIHAISAADHGEASEQDRTIIFALAREIGVPT